MFRMLEWRREKKNHSTPHSLMQMGIGIKIHFQRNKTHACQNFDSALDHDKTFFIHLHSHFYSNTPNTS